MQFDDHTGDRIEEVSPGTPTYKGRSNSQWKAYWQDELKAEEKRNREWRRQGDQVVKRYLDKRKDQGPQYNIGTAEARVNLFHSNTFILMAFLYGQTPKVDVSRRFGDANDDAARVASNIWERMLNTSVEPQGGDISTALWANLQDHLVPGLGVARVRYEFATKKEDAPPLLDEMTGEVVEEGYEREVLDWEDAPVDYVHWRDFHWGHCRMWKDCPWVGYDVYLTRNEATERFGAEKAKDLTYKNQQVPAEDENTDNPDTRDPDKTAKVCEIWDKKTLTAFWYHEDCAGMLDIKADPLQLSGFFPTPPPFLANESTDLFIPTLYFMLAQDLYNEVDQLSTRINIITNAVRVGGVYDAQFGNQLRSALTDVENTLIPVENYAQFAEKGKLAQIVDFFPVEDIIVVLDKLREMRREAIDLLYQVTGISDIMRGQGERYEGVGKAKLKAQFGSIRVQYLQNMFECWASNLLSIKAEVISKHFNAETIIEQSNIRFSHDASDPRLLEQAIALIKDYPATLWRIRVQPESMAMVDWAQMKSDRAEFLTALATFMQSSAPLIQQDSGAAPMLLELLKFGLAGFKGGQEIETVLDQAIEQVKQRIQQGQGQQQPESDSVKVAKLKLVENQQKHRADMQKQQDKFVRELQKLTAEYQKNLAEIRAETEAEIITDTVQADQTIRTQRARER